MGSFIVHADDGINGHILDGTCRCNPHVFEYSDIEAGKEVHIKILKTLRVITEEEHMLWIIGGGVLLLLVGLGILVMTKKKNDDPVVEPPVEPPVYTIPSDWEDEAYLLLYPDVAADAYFGTRPLEHWWKSGQAEGRIYKPEGWYSARYLLNNPDVAGDSYFSKHPLEHYWSSGKAEGRSFEGGPVDEYPTIPADWEDEAYLFHFKDMQPPISASEYATNPLKHWYDWGQMAGWQWKPNGWVSSEYLRLNSDIAADAYFGTRPLEHWWKSGQAEGRKYKKFQPPQTTGLHLILDLKGSQRCLFTGLRYKDGLLLGDYGLNVGGAKLQYFDGDKVIDEATFTNPVAESVFHIVLANDGVPICSNEHYAMMHRRQSNGSWNKTFGGTGMIRHDICFGIFKLGQVLYCFVHAFEDPTRAGFMIRSNDNGQTWQKTMDFNERILWCGNSDGQRVLIAGAQDNHPWVIDENNSTIAERGDLQGKGYYQLCGKNGAWNFLGNNFSGHGAFIDYWAGGTPRTVFIANRPYAMWSEVDPTTGYRIALFSVWNSTDYNDSQVAISKDNGQTWNQLCMVPTPCLLGTCFADGGVYLFGGKYQEYGRVYFYKF